MDISFIFIQDAFFQSQVQLSRHRRCCHRRMATKTTSATTTQEKRRNRRRVVIPQEIIWRWQLFVLSRRTVKTSESLRSKVVTKIMPKGYMYINIRYVCGKTDVTYLKRSPKRDSWDKKRQGNSLKEESINTIMVPLVVISNQRC